MPQTQTDRKTWLDRVKKCTFKKYAPIPGLGIMEGIAAFEGGRRIGEMFLVWITPTKAGWEFWLDEN